MPNTPIVDIPTVLSDLEKFYLSGAKNKQILVKLSAPVNDTVYLQALRSDTFVNTTINFLNKIKLYLASITYVQEQNNINSRVITNGATSKLYATNMLYNKHITKYKNSFSLDKASVNLS